MIMTVVSRTTTSCAPAMTTRIHQWARVGPSDSLGDELRVLRSVTATACTLTTPAPDKSPVIDVMGLNDRRRPSVG
jgi:hypothetical protein